MHFHFMHRSDTSHKSTLNTHNDIEINNNNGQSNLAIGGIAATQMLTSSEY